MAKWQMRTVSLLLFPQQFENTCLKIFDRDILSTTNRMLFGSESGSNSNLKR